VKNRLTWNVPIENVPFDPVLVTLSEGLKETVILKFLLIDNFLNF
jgi:hypothetical protein